MDGFLLHVYATKKLGAPAARLCKHVRNLPARGGWS